MDFMCQDQLRMITDYKLTTQLDHSHHLFHQAVIGMTQYQLKYCDCVS